MDHLKSDSKHFYRSVLRLGLPIALAQLTTSLLSVIDTFMVSSLGDNAIAAVGISSSFAFVLGITTWGILSGLAIYIAQYWGSQEIDNIHRVFIVSVIAAMLIASLFFVLGRFFPDFVISLYNNSDDTTNRLLVQDYGTSYMQIAAFSYLTMTITFTISMLMRSIEQVIIPQAISIVAVILNTFLNYLLINGNLGAPALGVEGAAIATLISSSSAAFVLILYLVFTKQEVLRIKWHLIKSITRSFLAKIFKRALPVIVNEAVWGLGMTMYIIALGFISPIAVSSMTISNQIMGLTWFLNAGISTACAVMLGNKLGSNDLETVREWGYKFQRLSFFAGLFLGVVLLISSGGIAGVFSEASGDVQTNVRAILIVFSFYVPIKFVNAIHIIGTLRSGGDTFFALISEIVPLWMVGVPLAFILSLTTSLPLFVIVALINIEELVKFVSLQWRFRSGKWIQNLTLE